MRSLPHKHRICECFSLGLPFLKRLYSNVCGILLCVFPLTSIGFVQCLSLGPLLSLYAYLCHVMLCVLCLSNLYVMSFSITLCCFNSFMRTLMHLCVHKQYDTMEFWKQGKLGFLTAHHSMHSYLRSILPESFSAIDFGHTLL